MRTIIDKVQDATEHYSRFNAQYAGQTSKIAGMRTKFDDIVNGITRVVIMSSKDNINALDVMGIEAKGREITQQMD